MMALEGAMRGRLKKHEQWGVPPLLASLEAAAR